MSSKKKCIDYKKIFLFVYQKKRSGSKNEAQMDSNLSMQQKKIS